MVFNIIQNDRKKQKQDKDNLAILVLGISLKVDEQQLEIS